MLIPVGTGSLKRMHTNCRKIGLKTNKAFALVALGFLTACGSQGGGDGEATARSRSDNSAMLKVDNLADQQQITEGVPTQFRISAKNEIDSVVVSSNGRPLGKAELSRRLHVDRAVFPEGPGIELGERIEQARGLGRRRRCPRQGRAVVGKPFLESR